MENFVLHAITAELAALLPGHRLGKTLQLSTTEIAVDVRLRDERWLVISTDPRRLALYLTKRALKHVAGARTDTPFISLFKKYLGGARISQIEHLGYDRVVRFSLIVEEETGTEVYRELVMHFTGRSANIFILENQRILAALRERASEEMLHQEPPPPQDKMDPFECPPEKLAALIARNKGDAAGTARLNLIGFDRHLAAEFGFRARRLPPEEALQKLLDEIYFEPPQPHVYTGKSLEEYQRDLGDEEFTIILSSIVFEHCREMNQTTFPTVNEAADASLTLIDQRTQFLAERQQLVSQLQAKIKKLDALLKNLRRERENFHGGEAHQRSGELLLANAHQAIKTDTAFLVTDFYHPDQVTIEIPTANQPTVQSAAEQYFKLARKAKHGLESINARLPEIEKQHAALHQSLAKISAARQWPELARGKAEAGISGRASQPQKSAGTGDKKKSTGKPISGTRRYLSSDQFEILVGRTSRDNDYLTLRIAKSFDLWFHAADYPGSHVILRNPRRAQVPPRTLLEAAQLAAKFSQANNVTGAKVAVNYCEKKFVTKPKGFAPGQVRLTSFKTMLVEPAEAGVRLDVHS